MIGELRQTGGLKSYPSLSRSCSLLNSVHLTAKLVLLQNILTRLLVLKDLKCCCSPVLVMDVASNEVIFLLMLRSLVYFVFSDRI